MNDCATLSISEIIQGPVWVSAEDGQKVYDEMTAALNAGRVVRLSFAGCEIMITAFLNVVIGQLYGGDYTDDFLTEHLICTDITEDDRVMLDRVIANAKRYFANQKLYDQAWQEDADEDEE